MLEEANLQESNNLWLVRLTPKEKNYIQEFLSEGVIVIGWERLGSLEGKNKDDIKKELIQKEYSTSNVTLGVINHFVNNMKVGDICIVPNGEDVYLAKIKGNYSYENNSKLYPHQRQVTVLNKNKPISRYEFPDGLQRSLAARNAVADLSHRINLLIQFINGGKDNDTIDNLEIRLRELLPKAIKNIKNDIESDDPTRRFNASIEVIKLIQKLD